MLDQCTTITRTLFIEYTVKTFKYLGKLFTTIYVQLCSKQKPSGHWVKLGVLNNSKKKKTISRG